jgi:hypothetical protein
MPALGLHSKRQFEAVATQPASIDDRKMAADRARMAGSHALPGTRSPAVDMTVEAIQPAPFAKGISSDAEEWTIAGDVGVIFCNAM